MRKPYETMIVFDGTLPEDVLQKEQHIIEELISHNAELEKTDVWGKKSLAYPVHKKRSGYYCLFIFSGTGEIVTLLEKHIKLNDKILRHLTVVRDLKNEVARQNIALRKERTNMDNEQFSHDNEVSGRNRERDRG